MAERDLAATDITISQQGSYEVLDLMARYAVTPRIEASLHAENVTDRKHLSSLMWDQAFYAQPRHYFASVRYRF